MFQNANASTHLLTDMYIQSAAPELGSYLPTILDTSLFLLFCSGQNNRHAIHAIINFSMR